MPRAVSNQALTAGSNKLLGENDDPCGAMRGSPTNGRQFIVTSLDPDRLLKLRIRQPLGRDLDQRIALGWKRLARAGLVPFQCLSCMFPHAFHLADALAPISVWKKWRNDPDIRLAHERATGSSPEALRQFLRGSAFGAKIVGERVFKDTAGRGAAGPTAGVPVQQQCRWDARRALNRTRCWLGLTRTEVFAGYPAYRTLDPSPGCRFGWIGAPTWTPHSINGAPCPLQKEPLPKVQRSMTPHDMLV